MIEQRPARDVIDVVSRKIWPPGFIQQKRNIMSSELELGAAETRVREGEEAIARLRRELERTSTHEAQMDLKRLEEEQARLIEIRNGLFRDVAGDVY